MARYYGLKNDPTKFHSCTLSMQTNDPIVPHDILQKGQPFLPYSKWRPPYKLNYSIFFLKMVENGSFLKGFSVL